MATRSLALHRVMFVTAVAACGGCASYSTDLPLTAPFEGIEQAFPELKVRRANSSDCPAIGGNYRFPGEIAAFSQRPGGMSEKDTAVTRAAPYRVHPRRPTPEGGYEIVSKETTDVLIIDLPNAQTIVIRAPEPLGKGTEQIVFDGTKGDFRCEFGIAFVRLAPSMISGEGGTSRRSTEVRIASSEDGALLYHQAGAYHWSSLLAATTWRRTDIYVRFPRLR
jgi:hypothetical protein